MRISLAIVLVAFSAAASAQQLGALFHTPKERETLDRMRRGEPVGQAEQAGVVRPDPVVTGYVKRSDGKSTVFLDKQPYPSRNERVQRLLEPRIIERLEPMALPPGPTNPSVSAPFRSDDGKRPANHTALPRAPGKDKD